MSAMTGTPTWWQRHAHLVVMWAAAAVVGLTTGLWLLAGILAAFEFVHQCVHAEKHHGADWRAGLAPFLVASVVVCLTTGLGTFYPYRFMYRQEVWTGWAVFAAVVLAIAGQVVVSEGWHRGAPPHRWEYQGSLLAAWPVRLLGVTAMVTGVWVTSGLLGL
jgi:hypothetical protein